MPSGTSQPQFSVGYCGSCHSSSAPQYCLGLIGTVFIWLSAYIRGQSSSVATANYESDEISLKYGVPQGSILAFLLFNLFMLPLCFPFTLWISLPYKIQSAKTASSFKCALKTFFHKYIIRLNLCESFSLLLILLPPLFWWKVILIPSCPVGLLPLPICFHCFICYFIFFVIYILSLLSFWSTLCYWYNLTCRFTCDALGFANYVEKFIPNLIAN